MREAMHRTLSRNATVAAATALLGISSAALAKSPPPPPAPPPPPVPPQPVELVNQFFDWTVNATLTPPPSYVQSPFLDDSNANSINTFLLGLPSGAIRAVKVTGPLSTTTTNLIFNNPSYNVSYVFEDLEADQGNAVTMAQTMTNQVRWVGGVVNSTATKSARAYVSNFAFQDATAVSASGTTTDPTMPDTYFANNHTKHSYAGFKGTDYTTAGLNMEAADLYPGSPSYKSPAYGNSSAPNIRSALFTLPAWRLGRDSDALLKNGLATNRNVPWVANFNNWGQPAGAGTLNDAPGTGGFQYYWSNPTGNSITGAGQNLSGRDFATLVAHYRLRGANSFNLLQSGIVGVSQTQMQDQAREGWAGQGPTGSADAAANLGHMLTTLSASDRRLLIGNEPNDNYGGTFNANSNIIEDGTLKNVEQAGAMFSGVYSLSQGKLDILLSNMDDSAHKLTLPNHLGGYALNTKDFNVAAGTHMLLEYSGDSKKKTWSLSLSNVPFTDLDNDRSKPGVPEPGVLSLLAVAGFYGMTRRRRRLTGELEV
jgi:hypothetical protein